MLLGSTATLLLAYDHANQGFERQEDDREEVDFLAQFAEMACQQGVSLFAYLADIASEDIGDRRFFSLEERAGVIVARYDDRRQTARNSLLDDHSVHMNAISMSITPQAIRDLLDELETSKQQSQLRAWSAT